MILTLDNLLDDSALKLMDQWLESAVWTPGKHSAGAQASRQKSNREMDQQCEQWKSINALVVNTLFQHAEFQRFALPLKVSAAFIAQYGEQDGYGLHTDDPVMGNPANRYRSDLACTVFLNQADEYDGGELSIERRTGAESIKLTKGSAVVYPASYLHEVKPVTRGHRTVAVLWVQSMVRDERQRDILAELGDARDALQMQLPDAKVTRSIDLTYASLMRLWAEV